MTIDAFRKLALSLPDAVESSHMGHPDFRVGGKIFASLQPEKGLAMVKLTPEQQTQAIETNPDTFLAVPGGWGARGATYIRLAKAPKLAVTNALVAALRNTAPAP